MKKSILTVVFLCLCASLTAQVEVGGVTFPKNYKSADANLVLNGAGVREKLWIDLYVAGLYLEEKSTDADAIIKSEEPMAIKLQIVSRLITSEKMSNAVEDGFENSTGGDTKPIATQIKTFMEFFKEEIKKGDIFDLVYKPGTGVVALKNNEKKGVIKGKEFKEALFGIWLSDKPAEDDLKEAMLGN
ncbi:chalcone isomerase family protein [Zunongwangia sp.]|uniref:chalcone isomerase family protein n=1 Tax=Zunongwangia sp. TaxID=1965325 RepID=UPI003AA82E16